jgi:hypothetical protein
LLVDLGSDDGIGELQAVWDRFQSSKTRLARESHLDEEDLGVSYTRTFLVPNKMDLAEASDRMALIANSARSTWRSIRFQPSTARDWRRCGTPFITRYDVVRVYTKLPTKKEPDYERPFTLPPAARSWMSRNLCIATWRKTLKGPACGEPMSTTGR